MTTKTPTKKTTKVTKTTKKRLSPEQELFCQLYVGNHDRELFGHGTKCYMEAYGHNKRIEDMHDQIHAVEQAHERGYTAEVKNIESDIKRAEKSARSRASQLLALVSIRARIDELMDSMITEEFYDREMLYVATQRYDLASKVAAMREFNALKKRIQKDPTPVVGPISIQISPDVLNKMGL